MSRPGSHFGWIIAIILLAVLAVFLYFKFFWVFSDGTKTGELNSLTYTGYVFKTYEGEIILTGYGTKNAAGTVQSKNFKFSVANKDVAEKLDLRIMPCIYILDEDFKVIAKNKTVDFVKGLVSR